MPKTVFESFISAYHFMLAFFGAVIYLFPSKKIKIIVVTGTKGKTTTTELLSAMLEEAGKKTALTNTFRFKVGQISERNIFKMTTPGRFFMQKFLRRAVREGCEYAVLEISSEAAKQHRHKFIYPDIFVFTNISPEHIESHGSFEKYLEAKLKIAKTFESSPKKNKVLVVNGDDTAKDKFLAIRAEQKFTFSLKDAEPAQYLENGLEFSFEGEKFSSHLSGKFNLYNILAAIYTAKSQGIDLASIKRALEKFSGVRGRVESVDEGQDFKVIVDYAHTSDSLEKLYEVFQNHHSICVLGNTGGGRDKWKRKEMAKIAEAYCDSIILTNEDPYDDDPMEIINDMKDAIPEAPVEVVLDRREAIYKAITLAKIGSAVLITGKGTDPFIMGAKGEKIPWDDADVAREELRKIYKK